MTKETITPPIGTAIHVDMPNEQYHSMGNWSHSQIKCLPAEPELFEWKYILKREEFTTTRAMVCGTAMHAWLLEGIEPTQVPRDYLTKSGSMKPGGWDAIAEEFSGIPVLKADELVGLRYARENCFADPEIRAYLETDGWVEHSLFSVDPDTELPTRVRLDKLCKFTNGLDGFDLKFSAGVDDRWIEKQITGMAYYSQAGMYWEHVEKAYQTPNLWAFLFVQSTPPYTARIKQLLPCDIDLGIRHTHVSLRDLRTRLDTNNWKGSGFGHMGITQVSKWKWEENPEPVEAFGEFAEFSTSSTSME
jgi:hypothetical protein